MSVIHNLYIVQNDGRHTFKHRTGAKGRKIEIRRGFDHKNKFFFFSTCIKC